jgi:signal transduction histidine kinase
MTSDNFVMNLSESKKQKELVKQLNKFLNMGKNSSILLLSLIDDILDLSKIEAGTIKINKSDFLVPELINEIHDIFIFQITQKKLELNIHIGERLKNNVINSDRHRIKQVFLNLISNALKFTFKGEIFIGWDIEVEDDRSLVKFEVRDTGIGVKKKDQPKLFKLFGMISDSKSLNPNGTGIGLTVCKKYAKLLGGDIKLVSKFGEGTSVSFTIPLTIVSENNDVSKAPILHNISRSVSNEPDLMLHGQMQSMSPLSCSLDPNIFDDTVGNIQEDFCRSATKGRFTINLIQ